MDAVGGDADEKPQHREGQKLERCQQTDFEGPAWRTRMATLGNASKVTCEPTWLIVSPVHSRRKSP
jgi:hypothetical protein